MIAEFSAQLYGAPGMSLLCLWRTIGAISGMASVKRISGRRIAAKAKKTASTITTQRLAKTGLTSRIRGHVSARGKRAQGRRDSR